MDKSKIEQIIGEALGETSALFMSHPDGGKIIMPTEELDGILKRTVELLTKDSK